VWKFSNETPLFLQIPKLLESDIFSGRYKEGEQVPSTTETSSAYHLNPATVLKGYNILVEEGIIEKRRGLGMFVTEGAMQKIKEKRSAAFTAEYVWPLVKEARSLGITKEKLIGMIREESL
jgi:DNA-binding transcriptional regulator YhcF (GntR family)